MANDSSPVVTLEKIGSLEKGVMFYEIRVYNDWRVDSRGVSKGDTFAYAGVLHNGDHTLEVVIAPYACSSWEGIVIARLPLDDSERAARMAAGVVIKDAIRICQERMLAGFQDFTGDLLVKKIIEEMAKNILVESA